MNRRNFILLSTVAALTPLGLSAKVVDYSPGMAKDALAAGKTVFLDFSATWCGTCAAQDRVINALLDENPDYGANVTFIKVDWDNFGDGALSNALKIPRRSTLVVLKGDKELGRIVAGTARKDIKKLMDTALRAAKS